MKWLGMTGYLFKTRLCEGSSLGTEATRRSADGSSKGSGFGFGAFSDAGLGFLANAGQYLNWNGTPCRVWMTANSVLENTRLSDFLAAENACDTKVCKAIGRSRHFILTVAF